MTNTNEIIVLNFNDYTAKKMSETQFIEEYSRLVPTPHGVAPEFQYDPETREVIRWMCGQYRHVVYGNCEPEFAHKKLLEWALMDAAADGIETARTKEEAVEFIDNFVSDCYDPEEDSFFIAQYEAMKQAL